MSAFKDSMEKMAKNLSDEAKVLIKVVVNTEHKRRFGNREDIPELYASEALKAAKVREGGE